ncbi:CHAT domain-containing protein [Calothrix sp. 336/3]|uniref:CHAT domain-containing protein n=1 Tax=Calothrix sp. 336/3 TaxID=1337936 RepID=UPI000A7E4B83|nr:CHAT domain-containing tetratricopeptide repeat protein [Calothrix sp. 336/3]
MIFLSDSVGARIQRTELQIAQQPTTKQPNATRAEAGKLTQEGLKLFQQGSAESLVAARKKWEAALVLWQKLGDKQWQATILTAIGRVYDSLGEKQEALKYYNQALPLFRAVGNKGGEATTLNNIGSVYDSLGEKQEALKYYNQALPLIRAVGNKGGEANTLNNIGLVYSDLGEKQEALKYYNQALPLFRAVGNKGGEATTLTGIGAVYSDLGEKQEALKFLNQALPLFRTVGDRRGEATTLINIGAVYSDLGEKQEALKYFNQALPLFRTVGDRRGEAATLTGIGAVYSDLGENQEALKYFNQALPLFRTVGDRRGEAATLSNIGLVYSDLGEKQEALKFLNQALPLIRAVDDHHGETGILGNLASLERKQGNLQASLKHIETAIQIIEALRSTYTDQNLKTQYFATVQGYYQFYIDLLMELHKKDPSKGYNTLAFNASERSRARSLIELLTESQAKIRKGVDPKLLQQETEIQQKIDAQEKLKIELSQQENINSTINKIAQADAQLNTLRAEYKELQNKIRISSPAYANIKYPQPLTLSQVQQQVLDEETVLLQYSLAAERSYLWMVTKTGMRSFELAKQSDIEELVENYRDLLENHPDEIIPVQLKEGQIAARKLSQILLQPVVKELGNKRLLIVADGGLQSIPFGVLPIPSLPINQQTGDGFKSFLLAKHEIVYSPSATVIAELRKDLQKRKPAEKALAIFADAVFGCEDRDCTKRDTRLQSLKGQKTPRIINRPDNTDVLALKRAAKNNRDLEGRLPATKKEAEGILSLFEKNSTFQAFDFAASRENVLNQSLNQYKIVHFATHGTANFENPELSGIVLSLFDSKGKGINGYLRLVDIFNLNLAAELVVLSACETGIGKETKGEGLMGLTRGFMYAGSPRLAVSLWNVNDESTSVLMQKMYKKMLQGKMTPAAALRAAQLEMLESKEYADAHYWAAFTLQGEWR